MPRATHTYYYIGKHDRPAACADGAETDKLPSRDYRMSVAGWNHTSR